MAKKGRPRHFMTPVDQHVAERLRLIRLSKVVTIEQMAKFIGISYQGVQRYEAGKGKISAGRLKQLADALGVTPNDFFEGLPGEFSQIPIRQFTQLDFTLLRAIADLPTGGMKRTLIQLIELIRQH
jgi:transcriptional regulator with XRE-family HTH domain